MENIEQMKERHEKEIEDLQSKCSHPESEWMPYMWAPGHFGPNVKVCRSCGKIVEKEKTPLISEAIELEAS